MSAAADTKLRVAPAHSGQRDAIVQLWRDAGLTVPWNDPRADYDLAAGKPNSDVLVGLAGGRVVAALIVGHDGHRGWLYYVGVDPLEQKAGHGAAIVAAGEAWLTARGMPKAMLMVRDTNVAVEAFYHRIGYETVPRKVLQKWLRDVPG